MSRKVYERCSGAGSKFEKPSERENPSSSLGKAHWRDDPRLKDCHAGAKGLGIAGKP